MDITFEPELSEEQDKRLTAAYKELYEMMDYYKVDICYDRSTLDYFFALREQRAPELKSV
jgi:hypothetical protein